MFYELAFPSHRERFLWVARCSWKVWSYCCLTSLRKYRQLESEVMARQFVRQGHVGRAKWPRISIAHGVPDPYKSLYPWRHREIHLECSVLRASLRTFTVCLPANIYCFPFFSLAYHPEQNGIFANCWTTLLWTFARKPRRHMGKSWNWAHGCLQVRLGPLRW